MSDTRLLKLKEILQKAVDLGHLVQKDDWQTEDVTKQLQHVWCELEESKLPSIEDGTGDTYASSTMQEFLTELKILATTSGHLGQCFRRLEFLSTTKFTSSDYAQKLLDKLSFDDDDDVGEIDWMQMAPDAVRIINRAPGILMLGGTLNTVIVPKEQKHDVRSQKGILEQRVRRILSESYIEEEELVEKETPEQLDNIEEDENSVDIQVRRVQRILHQCYKNNKYQPISFYDFILHPTNFTTTVENIFYISFVIRDGLARLGIVDDDMIIEPMEDSEKSRTDGLSAEKFQMVFSITVDEWKDLVKAYDIKEPALV